MLAQNHVGEFGRNVDEIAQIQAVGFQHNLCISQTVVAQIWYNDLFVGPRVDGEKNPSVLFYLFSGSWRLLQNDAPWGKVGVYRINDGIPQVVVSNQMLKLLFGEPGKIRNGPSLAVLSIDFEKEKYSNQKQDARANNDSQMFPDAVFKNIFPLRHGSYGFFDAGQK